MKAHTYSIEVEASLTLTKRELQLLNHIFSYENKDWMDGVLSGTYAGGVTKDELKEFTGSIRSETGKLMAQIEDAKTKLFKNQ